jgi:hypothetical protein
MGAEISGVALVLWEAFRTGRDRCVLAFEAMLRDDRA